MGGFTGLSGWGWEVGSAGSFEGREIRSSLGERDALAPGGILPLDRFCTQFVTDHETSSGLHASFDVVIELILPGVDLRRADVQAWFALALLAKFGIDDDERVRVLCETDRTEPLVEGQFFALGHARTSSLPRRSLISVSVDTLPFVCPRNSLNIFFLLVPSTR